MSLLSCKSINEPPRDKTNKVSVRPAKTQISLGIRPVWSESSLSAWRKFEPLAIHWAHSQDSDQTERMSLRWAHSHIVGFVMLRLKWIGYNVYAMRQTVCFLANQIVVDEYAPLLHSTSVDLT